MNKADDFYFPITALSPPDAEILKAANETADWLNKKFQDSTDYVSGWAHAFVCPECTAKLTFDFDTDFHIGMKHTCKNCGKTVYGEEYDGGWVYYYRYFTAKQLEDVAAAAVSGNKTAVGFIERFVDFYADNYEFFPLHGKDNGRIMPQALDEAVWCINVLHAVYPCRKFFAEEKLEKWYKKLFLPLVDVLTLSDKKSFAGKYHNHVLWHRTAMAAIALCFDDEALLEYALESEYGIRQHMEKCLTADGLWFEGSVTYHYYSIEAFTSFCEFYLQKNPDDPLFDILKKVYCAPMLLSFDGFRLPSVNDGWYPLTLDKFTGQTARADGVIKRRTDGKDGILLSAVKDKISVLESSKVAVMREPFFVMLKSGTLNDCHRHRDSLSVIIPEFSEDLATPGYAHKMTGEYYKAPISHNTVSVDMCQPISTPVSAVKKTENGIAAEVTDGWYGVKKAERRLTAENGVLYDRTELLLDGVHTADWIFHFAGDCDFSGRTEPADIGNENGYQYLTDCRKILENKLDITFTSGVKKLCFSADISGKEAFICRSPGNPANIKRTAIILRTKSTSAVFDAQFRLTKKP